MPHPDDAIDGIDLEFRPRSYHADLDLVAAHTQDNSGDEHLSRYRTAEFEIARIVLDSTRQDVFSILARRRRGSTRYRYRVVDEYESVFELTRQTSVRPLSLREVIHLIDTAKTESMELKHERLPEGIVWWQVHESQEPPEVAARFVRISSAVYPELERYYAARLLAWVRGEVAGGRSRIAL
jgi:hypothetical protein